MVDFGYLIQESLRISEIITQYAVTPLLILFVGLALAAFLRNLVRSGLQAVQFDMRVSSKLPISPTSTISHVVFAIVSLVSVSLAFASVGLLGFVLQRVAFFLLGFAALAAILAGTDGVRNLVKKQQAIEQYKLGDTYHNHGLSGVVKKHGLTHLVIFTTQAERVHVPYLTAVQEAH